DAHELALIYVCVDVLNSDNRSTRSRERLGEAGELKGVAFQHHASIRLGIGVRPDSSAIAARTGRRLGCRTELVRDSTTWARPAARRYSGRGAGGAGGPSGRAALTVF